MLVRRAALSVAIGIIGSVTLAIPSTVQASPPVSHAIAASCSYNGGHPTIRFGSSGSAVAHAQCLLREFWGYRITVDGSFGMATSVAVRDFQVRCAPPVDGIIGPATWNALHPDTSPC
ncbi:peptidoglycan-binding domain-containing protein [Micromonospora lutea]|uniref:peptidoglycan-binding domain-containing protein n=1 Tax=Micromonospora lutea TaxID=419825 RepID=UPI00194ECD8F|nr:peptidoglycan-binding domain-containing protein [Micromonospora lutea]